MESTGKYRIPVFNILEDEINVIIANPKWVKAVKGTKDDTVIESIEGYQMTDAQKYRMRLVRAHMDYITAEINDVDKMIENGLIEEVENLRRKYNHFPTAMQGLGYKEVVQYFQKELTKEEMIEKIKQESRRYAKRQLTWFRKNKQTIWIDGLANLEDNINIIEKELNK